MGHGPGLGSVNRVVADDELTERALELAAPIAANAPVAQRGNKRVIRAVLAAKAALDPTVERELLDLRRNSLSSEDFGEAVLAFTEKRSPVWRDR